MHNRFSDFTTTEQSGTTFVTAVPSSGADERVRFDASIAAQGSSDDPTANWEEIISVLAQSHLGEQFSIDDGRGVMTREDAVAALVDSDAGHVHNAHAAHAVIEYLASEGIFKLEDDRVVVLMSYDDIQEEGSIAMLNNWAATLDACVDRIEAAVDRVEQNKETLEKHFNNLSDTQGLQQKYRQKKNEIEQEMKAMLGGRMPSELSEESQREFEMKRKRYHRYQSLEESAGPRPGVTNGPEMLANVVEDLQAIKDILLSHSQDFRIASLNEQLTGSGAQRTLENLTGLVAQLSDVTEPEEKMNEMSNDEFVQQMMNVSESTTETTVEATDSELLNEQR